MFNIYFGSAVYFAMAAFFGFVIFQTNMSRKAKLCALWIPGAVVLIAIVVLITKIALFYALGVLIPVIVKIRGCFLKRADSKNTDDDG
jgi:hypothetical protein